MQIFLNNRWFIYGITSFGVGECDSNGASYFAMVPIQLDWIKSTKNSSKKIFFNQFLQNEYKKKRNLDEFFSNLISNGIDFNSYNEKKILKSFRNCFH